MKQEVIYPKWNTKAFCLKKEIGDLTEYELFSYSTWICLYQEWVTKSGEVQYAIRFNDEPYKASITTAKHLKWFLSHFVAYFIEKDVTNDWNKSYVKIMCESPAKVYPAK